MNGIKHTHTPPKNGTTVYAKTIYSIYHLLIRWKNNQWEFFTGRVLDKEDIIYWTYKIN